ncbi:hypothetical protein K1T71_006928 [Dendrolimus kikuchii]|uniref:Uncharacterized protein n=1 Tax=Dendrolimus kikuchii TaxID=765133 RepID=A0ACC1CZL8_9NEOP|nr:hypothetical protein K1T71_006928 [Dendrolimus kikuchii]
MSLDPAELVEKEFLARQIPMNAIIDRGDSIIQQCYKNSVVFITGATGFLGKQLVEKLIRSCEVKKIYLLLRCKKGMTLEQRINLMLKQAVFETIHDKKPGFQNKLIPISGDISEPGLAMYAEDWKVLTKEVDVIFHLAATTRFDEELDRATLLNVRGTREVISFGKACKKLRTFVHVSTAFTHATRSRINCDVLEEFYPCAINPEHLIEIAEGKNDCGLRDQIPELMSDWPNTYTFTKAVAEELVRLSSGDLPISIIRPPVVGCTAYEPTPGWIDRNSVMGPNGVILGIGLGAIHVLLTKDIVLSTAPVDMVTNATIAVGWDTATRWNAGDRTPKIFTISSYKMGVTWTQGGNYMRTDIIERLSTPKAFWYTYMIDTGNWFVYWVLTWFLHYIPAYLVDGVLKITGIKIKGVPSVVKIYQKIYKMTVLYSYFLMNEWAIRDYKLMELFSKMSESDKLIYNYDISPIEHLKLIDVTCIGLRKFVLKDNLKGSIYARKKQKVLKVVNALFIALYIYVIWKAFCLLFNVVCYLFNLVY